jgi:hypothetical protein
MQILVCIDDTDSIDAAGKRGGTGELAQMISQAIEENGWGKCEGVTRHQLLIHEDIPYTSHNSAMCFKAEIEEESLQPIIDYASDLLARESEPEADPGLCVAAVDNLTQRQRLIQFGYLAKQKVLTKEDAYGLAEELDVHLSEHGGDGMGVIGALAGAGLRLGGNDGRFKGGYQLGKPGQKMTVSQLREMTGVDEVRSLEGRILEDDVIVSLGRRVKSNLLDGKKVFLVHLHEDEEGNAYFKTCSKETLCDFEEENAQKGKKCDLFVADVEEERVSDELVSCYNCRSRRWTPKSFECTNPAAIQ